MLSQEPTSGHPLPDLDNTVSRADIIEATHRRFPWSTGRSGGGSDVDVGRWPILAGVACPHAVSTCCVQKFQIGISPSTGSASRPAVILDLYRHKIYLAAWPWTLAMAAPTASTLASPGARPCASW